MILRLAMIGFGNVGQEFARLLMAKRDWLLKRKGLDIEVLAIATKTRGSIMADKALDLERALTELEDHGSLRGYGPGTTNLKPLDIIDKSNADLMIELTPLNIDDGQPAIDHISMALQSGMDVVTANKGPVAFAYDKLRSLARSRNVHFRFEGTVMDGTPIFNLAETTLQGCEILGIEGVLNSTSNFVLTEMAAGRSMDAAIKEAQRRGFAEADPSMDIDGWDAAAKITALANVLMDAGSNPKLVNRKGIRDISDVDIRAAADSGRKFRQIASATREREAIELKVEPVRIGPDSLYWPVDGTSSAVTLKTDLMGEVTIVETNPAVAQTAYAVFSDMLLVVEAIRCGTL